MALVWCGVTIDPSLCLVFHVAPHSVCGLWLVAFCSGVDTLAWVWYVHGMHLLTFLAANHHHVLTCADGFVSHAKHLRGACSHHGGVWSGLTARPLPGFNAPPAGDPFGAGAANPFKS